ncbi:MAG: DUF305 domain-containing protein [Spirochaetae bacterium HGW-Spirochaetae-5]|nr:MAG: DUF305 domain-containing protein [Spirochaetae bacterium HGW-Spirochaetae-5]
MNRVSGFLYVMLMGVIITAAAYPQGKGMMDMSGNKGSMKGGMMMNMSQMDRHFIEKMIPHHLDAIEMAKLALDKSKKSEIKKLAKDIITSQTAEIESMKKWYKEWFGTDVPAKPSTKSPMGNDMGMMGQGMKMMDMSMDHNMMGGTLDDLKKAPDFDKRFLEMMVKHHKMAIPMSGMIIDSQKSEMRKLAKDIISAQSGEIEMMIKWYQNWYGSW